ncbi:recombinase family protein [Micromonospora sp. NPDC049891]|uniref:recombinase family protein n=1 Tax=Micromonospora sp. NPDC049891 TaxID=3155655 RepID=UPI0033F59DF1
MTSLRLLGAVRLSRHRGEADPSTSPERQTADVEFAAAEESGEIIGWARDLDVSAIKLTPFERPELGPWLKRPQAYDGIVWSRADRAVRSMRDMHSLSEWAVQNRKLIIFAIGPGGGPKMRLDFRSGPLDTMTQLMLMLFAFAAEMEANVIKERNRDTKAFMRATGRWGGGMFPYWAMPEKQGNEWRLIHNPDTVPATLDIIDRVLKKESKQSVMRWLNDEGILSPREYRIQQAGKVPTAPISGVVSVGEGTVSITPEDGSEAVTVNLFPKHVSASVEDGQKVEEGDRLTKRILWSAQTIKMMLRSRALLGQVELDGKPFLGPDGMPVKRVEPLTDLDTFEKLQRILDASAVHDASTRTAGAGMLLRIGWCGICGERLYRRSQPKPYGRYEYYGCRSAWGYLKKQSSDEKCRALAISAELLESTTEEMLLKTIGNLEVLEKVVIPAQSHHQELAEAEEAYAFLYGEAAKKPANLARLLQPQIKALEKRIAVLSALPEREEREELRATGETYAERWELADAGERRKMLLEAGVRIEAVNEDTEEVAVRSFERPQRDDEAVWLGSTEGVSYAFYVPKDLAERATGKSQSLGFVDQKL